MFAQQNSPGLSQSVITSTFQVQAKCAGENWQSDLNGELPKSDYSDDCVPQSPCFAVSEPNVQSKFEPDNGWYTPQQFVPSHSYPYFKNPQQTNIMPPHQQYYQQLHYNQQACNYTPNSSPSLEQLILNVPQYTLQQHRPPPSNQYYLKAALSYRQLSPAQKKKTKRNRTAFTTDQILALEEVYGRQLYVSKTERESLTKRLGLTDRAIKVWFQNRRMKGKRDLQDSFESSSDSSPSVSLEDIENEMQQCEVVNDYVSMPTELCDKLGELINQYVPKEFVDSGLDSSSLESSATAPESVSTTQEEISPSTSLELPNSVSVEEDSAVKDEPLDQDYSNDSAIMNYEPISPAEGLPIELPTWKPQNPEEMKMLFDRHFC